MYIVTQVLKGRYMSRIPLICLGEEKMTSDTGPAIRFAAHRTLAKKHFHSAGILFANQFEEVAWPHVHRTLHEEVPKLFQLWACKHVMGIVATNHYVSTTRDKSQCPKCPCCTVADETQDHILQCEEQGRVTAFNEVVDALEEWMEEADTEPELAELITEFVRSRGSESLSTLTFARSKRYLAFARSQDTIGWNRFLEGMISKELVSLQQQHLTVADSPGGINKWTGQWVYRNYLVHDSISGALATKKKRRIT